MRDLAFQARRAALEADRRAREAEAYEASLPWLFRVSAKVEVWGLIVLAEVSALGILVYLVGMFR